MVFQPYAAHQVTATVFGIFCTRSSLKGFQQRCHALLTHRLICMTQWTAHLLVCNFLPVCFGYEPVSGSYYLRQSCCTSISKLYLGLDDIIPVGV